ncbi:mandelate racemase/muconate lactonizing enzyme family protein [Haloplanus sp. GCM10025708]|uniref:mandelate racemase/muconate lactonizing enzyme family protein n=1 Tax=Haloferacaceae TaxID=1644056 RepID=UPI00360DDC6D
MTTVSDVSAVSIRTTLDEPFGSATGWHDTRSTVLVRVEADDGTVGWGECWGPIAGNREIVEEYLAPMVEGEDPMRVERIHDRLYGKGRNAFKAHAPLTAISGVDIALWDLKGKLLGEPVSTLLGGRERDRIQAYATGHYFKYGADIDEQYRRITEEAKGNAEALGSLKCKIGLETVGYGYEEDIELVRRIREAVGDEPTLMVDANCAYDPGTAREVGHALEELDVYWFEEPVAPHHVDAYASLRETLDLRVAGGESHGPHEFDRLFDAGAVDIAQPDAAVVGGLTPIQRIVTQGTQHGIPVVPHVWGTSVTLAASLNLVSTLPGNPWFEFDRSPNPVRRLAKDTIETDDDGMIPVPDGPGLGIELDADKIETYRV